MENDFSLENIQKLTKESKERYNKILEQQANERLKWIKRRIIETASKGGQSYTYNIEDNKINLVNKIREYFIKQGFSVNAICHPDHMVHIIIDWIEKPEEKESVKRKLFRHFM